MRTAGGRLLRLAAACVIAGVAAAPAAEPRFFVAGDGRLEIMSRATGERADVRYRGADGSYDWGAMNTIRRVMRSKGGGAQGDITPRFVELLGHLYQRTGRPLVLLSGYRTPAYNEGIRRRGGKAVNGSMHTEGMAADLAFPRDELFLLWLHVRSLECCGAGYYAPRGFLHVDSGLPRFWEAATSRADEDLNGGNARLFARTDFDRYVAGDMLLVRLHGVTAPPIRLERTARFVPDGGGAAREVRVEDIAGGRTDGCLEADAATRLAVEGAPASPRGRVVFTTCAPRVDRTPERVETNPVSLR